MWAENKQRLCSYPRQLEMLYVSTESWQTRFHSSAPVRVLQGELSVAPARPRRLDFFLASSPPSVGVKWGTNRQQRKWLTATDRQATSTPCRDKTRGRKSASGMPLPLQPAKVTLWKYESYLSIHLSAQNIHWDALTDLEKAVEHPPRWADKYLPHSHSLV